MTFGGTDIDCADKDYDISSLKNKEEVLRKSDQYGEFFVSNFWNKTNTIMYRIYCSDYDFDDALYIKLYNSESKKIESCNFKEITMKTMCLQKPFPNKHINSFNQVHLIDDYYVNVLIYFMLQTHLLEICKYSGYFVGSSDWNRAYV